MVSLATYIGTCAGFGIVIGVLSYKLIRCQKRLDYSYQDWLRTEKARQKLEKEKDIYSDFDDTK